MKEQSAKRKKYRKTNVYPFLNKMYRLFETSPELFVLKKIKYRRIEGEYDPSKETISIDYRKEMLSTLVHEVLHYIHPKWTESHVIREERLIMNSITVRQIRHVLKNFSRLL